MQWKDDGGFEPAAEQVGGGSHKDDTQPVQLAPDMKEVREIPEDLAWVIFGGPCVDHVSGHAVRKVLEPIETRRPDHKAVEPVIEVASQVLQGFTMTETFGHLDQLSTQETDAEIERRAVAEALPVPNCGEPPAA